MRKRGIRVASTADNMTISFFRTDTSCGSRALLALAFFAAAACPFQVSAQAYPSKPVKIVVGYAAGGAVDIVARTVGQALSASIGQPFRSEERRVGKECV